MSDDTLLKNFAGGGIGAVVLGVVYVGYKCFQGRNCKSHSGCIDIQVSSPHKEKEHFTVDVPPARTPSPSLEATPTAIVLDNPELLACKASSNEVIAVKT